MDGRGKNPGHGRQICQLQMCQVSIENQPGGQGSRDCRTVYKGERDKGGERERGGERVE